MQARALLSSRSRRTVADSRLGDETLAGRAAAGDNDAFTALYERYYGPLLSYCRSILLDSEDARDATQSALENALRALPRREPNRPLKPWLYRIAHNEAINIVRLRARSVRAHLRSCDDCASFQRSITARRADLHVIGWLPGATGLSLLGSIGATGGAGGAGGAALLAAGGGSAVGGVGPGWTSLPVAVKGLAVAAAVATSGGAAAVEIRQIRKDSSRTTKPQVAESGVAARASPHTAAASAGSAKRATGAASRISSAHVQSGPSTPHETAVPKRAKVPPVAATASASSSGAPQTKPAPGPVAHRVATKTPVQIAIDKLTSLREQIHRAYAEAQTTAAAGTPAAVQTANTTLQQTLDALRPTLERVLGSVGLEPPAAAAVPAVPASDPTQTNILEPVQQMLGGVSALLQNLLSRPSN